MRREEDIPMRLSLLKHEPTCGIILEKDVDLLDHRYDVEARDGLAGINEMDLFLKYGCTKSDSLFCLVVHNIDSICEERQYIWYLFARDRSVRSYQDLLEEVVIVFTVSSKDALKKVLLPLWHFGEVLID